MIDKKNKFAVTGARKGAAAMLVFWLSGIALLFCCGPSMTARAAEHSCPLARSGSAHCQRSKTAPAVSFVDSGENCADGCLLFPAVFDKNRKLENTHLAVGLTPGKMAAFAVPLVLKERQPMPIPRKARFIDRSYTFIRNCTYRI